MAKLEQSAALVVLSGGQDSVTCLAWALHNYERVGCVTFNYGQRHAREIDAAYNVVRWLRLATGNALPHDVVELGAGVLLGTSPLVDPAQPLEQYPDHATMERIIGDRVELTFVPMRNPLFLTLAANRAVAGGYGNLVTGVCQEDNANYSDCRENFVLAMQHMVDLALGLSPVHVPLAIRTPLMHLSKPETVALARRLPHGYEALALSHTAYDGTYPPSGADHATVLRAHGFEMAGVPDPLVVRAHHEGLCALPGTANYDQAKVADAMARLDGVLHWARANA